MRRRRRPSYGDVYPLDVYPLNVSQVVCAEQYDQLRTRIDIADSTKVLIREYNLQPGLDVERKRHKN
jgi:hypothetical protein